MGQKKRTKNRRKDRTKNRTKKTRQKIQQRNRTRKFDKNGTKNRPKNFLNFQLFFKTVYYIETHVYLILRFQVFDGIESEWPFFFIYLALDGNDIVKTSYLKKLVLN